jgi:hypothetical protein
MLIPSFQEDERMVNASATTEEGTDADVFVVPR